MHSAPHARSTRAPHRTVRSQARVMALLLPAVMVAASCAGGDDATDDATDITTDTTSDTTSDATTDATATGDTATGDTTASTMVDDTTGSTIAGADSEAAQVLTETLAGQGVDIFLTFLPVVGFEQVTQSDEITIFVPSDEAFTSMGTDELAALIQDPQAVVDILQAHVIEGRVTGSDLEGMSTVQPIRGDELAVSVDGDQVMVGEATVIRSDLEFDGGVVHIIDDVLLLEEL